LLTDILTNNTSFDWIVAALLFLLTVVAFKLFIGISASRIGLIAEKTENTLDDVLVHLLQNVKVLSILFLGFYIGTLSLWLPPVIDQLLQTGLVLVLLLQGALWSNSILDHLLLNWAARRFSEDLTVSTALGSIGFLVRCMVWSIFLMLALGNVGIDVGPLIASLGIGGIALALALQNILSDLFGSFTIVFDKPFVVGDYIEIAGFEGTVKHVGMKSTRIEALSGEQLILSNSDLLSGRIRNFEKRDKRRVNFNLSVAYDTSPEQLELISGVIKKIVDAEEKAQYGRSVLKKLGANGIDFEVVYFMERPDLGSFAAVNHTINMEILKSFRREGIEFSRPGAQTLGGPLPN